jgi:hypothetical protein
MENIYEEDYGSSLGKKLVGSHINKKLGMVVPNYYPSYVEVMFQILIGKNQMSLP